MKPLGETRRHYWLVKRMAGHHGLDMADVHDRGDLDQETWAEVVQQCRGCDWTEGCERYLARSDTAGGVPENCRNRLRLTTLKAIEEMDDGLEFQ